MNLSPSHLKRYKDVALLFMKHGNASLMDQTVFPAAVDEAGPKGEPEKLAEDLEKLGPTFVKIGQLLSTRGDLLPPAYLEALSRLQDHVAPVAVEELEAVLQEELGVRLSKAFESFERTPIAAASLGQVHLATLRGGRQVAVKIQRPGIRQQIVKDLDSFAEIAAFLDEHTEFGRRYETSRLIDQFRASLLRELDYQKEALHLAELKRNLADFPRLLVPEVVEDFTSSRVLTMEYLGGSKITALSGAVMVEVDGAGLADELFRAYMKQILVDGFFHADPHPGNLLLTEEHQIAILDLGMTGRIHQRMRDQIVHLLAGIAEGNGMQAAEAAMNMGTPKDRDIDRVGFTSAVEEVVGAAKSRTSKKFDMGTIVLEVTKACADAGLRIPSEMALLGKTLMNLDRVGFALCPDFDPHEAIRRNLTEISQARVKDNLTSANIMGTLIELKQFLGQFPTRMGRIMEMLADNKMAIRVDSIDEKALVSGLQKVANRITVGLMLAAFIVGSSLMARVETSFRLFGYPGFAAIFFLIAAAGALVLFVQILFKDR